MTLDLKEKHVSKSITEFLEYHNWRIFRMQSAMYINPRGKRYRLGECGIPDFLAIRYGSAGTGEFMWVETKRPTDRRKCPTWCARRALSDNPTGRDIVAALRGKRTKVCTVCSQAEWREAEIERGAVVIEPRSFEDFELWYELNYSGKGKL